MRPSSAGCARAARLVFSSASARVGESAAWLQQIRRCPYPLRCCINTLLSTPAAAPSAPVEVDLECSTALELVLKVPPPSNDLLELGLGEVACVRGCRCAQAEVDELAREGCELALLQLPLLMHALCWKAWRRNPGVCDCASFSLRAAGCAPFARLNCRVADVQASGPVPNTAALPDAGTASPAKAQPSLQPAVAPSALPLRS